MVPLSEGGTVGEPWGNRGGTVGEPWGNRGGTVGDTVGEGVSPTESLPDPEPPPCPPPPEARAILGKGRHLMLIPDFDRPRFARDFLTR